MAGYISTKYIPFLHEYLDWYLEQRAYKITTYNTLEEQQMAIGISEENEHLKIEEAE